MGQKVKPTGLRLGIVRNWDSVWYADKKSYATLLHSDIEIRNHILKAIPNAGISKVFVERLHKICRVTVHAAKPAVIIGKKGNEIEKLKADLAKIAQSGEVALNIVDIKRPDLEAKCVGDSIAQQIENRVQHKRAMKRAIQASMRAGANGIRIICSGRLGGAEIARSEEYKEGSIPLHTLRADIDYAESTAYTTYGVIGVKVWIYRGNVYEKSFYQFKDKDNNSKKSDLNTVK